MSTPLWPNDYHAWTGSFGELVRTAGQVLSEQDPQARKPTASLVRHYQQLGAVGRGMPQGRSRQFSFEDLAAVVATKGLVKRGVGLDMATQVLSQSSPAQKLSYADYTEAGSNTPKVAPEAVDTVAQLLSQAGLPKQAGFAHSAFALGHLGGAAQGVRSMQSNVAASFGSSQTYTVSDDLSSPDPGMPVRAMQPTTWLSVFFNPEAMAQAPVPERHQAAQALETLLRQLRGTSLP